MSEAKIQELDDDQMSDVTGGYVGFAAQIVCNDSDISIDAFKVHIRELLEARPCTCPKADPTGASCTDCNNHGLFIAV